MTRFLGKTETKNGMCSSEFWGPERNNIVNTHYFFGYQFHKEKLLKKALPKTEWKK